MEFINNIFKYEKYNKNIQELPIEIIINIILYTDINTLLTLKKVSKKFHKICEDKIYEIKNEINKNSIIKETTLNELHKKDINKYINILNFINIDFIYIDLYETVFVFEKKISYDNKKININYKFEANELEIDIYINENLYFKTNLLHAQFFNINDYEQVKKLTLLDIIRSFDFIEHYVINDLYIYKDYKISDKLEITLNFKYENERLLINTPILHLANFLYKCYTN